jgi:glutamine synthetase
VNLLAPGKTPKTNLMFLTFFVNTIKAVHDYADLMRASIASPSNDFRLGANEAPPAIISVFTGKYLFDVLQEVKNRVNHKFDEQDEAILKLDLHRHIPELLLDNTDRNRTSPFAFTGNKFEFRAVSSGQSVAGPNTVLNTIVADSLDYIATKLEADVKAGKDFNKSLQTLLSDIIKQHKRVIFNGDGYSEAWHAEAEKRGLPNMKTTVDAVPALIAKDTIELFGKFKVLNERELHSRYEIYLENYNKTINIEAQLTASIAKTYILPAAIRYQGEVAHSLAAVKAAGVNNLEEQQNLLSDISKTIAELQKKTAALVHATEHAGAGDAISHARHSKDAILPAMRAVRELGDKLETVVADDLWPLPTYREMLFIK